MKRRDFIKNATALGAVPALIEAAEAVPFDFIKAPGFSLKIMQTDWGFTQGNRDAFLSKSKAEGYDGVELWVPQQESEQQQLSAQLNKAGLELGLLCGSYHANFDQHLSHFESSLQKAVSMKPLYINCHSGRDWFSFEQNKAFITLTSQYSKASGIPIYHETHRGRMLFAAHIARQFIQECPDLRLTLDISHWCNVHESLLNDQEETVELALSRTDHIHTRVGHAEGPQVNDPRAPEWDAVVQRHLQWWDKVVALKAAAGEPLTMLTEFGPPNYLPALPYTRQPVADQWAINVYMKDLLRKRYA